MLFDNLAFAMGGAAGNGGAQGNPLGAFVPLILMFAIFYFLLIRPQQKKAKQHKEMINNLKIGDRIVTNGGLYGTIVRMKDATVIVEIADKVQVEMLRNTVADKAEAFEKLEKKEK
ncbi:protein translocase subunit yajC [Humidesulfovibrio mexicanus]|uniref:Sec translocon accessory complex subunit YajC n=1 Tax=Humidesulfovibrio mexicanus TaxID=147047 RepID=A0A239CZH7_9BACT|nr:preprotein translocase subunit YajC [Humidesulfovibrio mexicanus]SNS25520.1 protein translocase subunit yajC [Humidesulfovibrio mexicanus]